MSTIRVSGDFLNWIESQKLDGESINQAAQRILKEVSGTSTDLSTVSTVTTKNVDKLVATSLDPVLERLAAVEERLGKLSA
ncbi:MAG: hypothetical protein EAZ09_19810 [Oscillatoriales cyanobacterium]|nr:MAG: hypothetical protein EAZ09_19810 [Oscillatoriales cyanobacterium]